MIPHRQIWFLVQIGAAIFALRTLGSLIALWLRASHVRVLKSAIYRLREDLLNRLFVLSRAAYSAARPRHDPLRGSCYDTERLDEMSHAMAARLLPAIFSSVVLLALLAFLNRKLLLLTVAMRAAAACSRSALTGRLVKRRVFVFQRAFETFSNGILFVLQHMDLTLVQSFEAREAQRRLADMARLRRASRADGVHLRGPRPAPDHHRDPVRRGDPGRRRRRGGGRADDDRRVPLLLGGGRTR